jgi:hypothetical protein
MNNSKISNRLAANAPNAAEKLRFFRMNLTKNIPARAVSRKSILPSVNWRPGCEGPRLNKDLRQGYLYQFSFIKLFFTTEAQRAQRLIFF